MSHKWLFLTMVSAEPVFRGGTRLKKIGIPVERITWIEETERGTMIRLDDGQSIEVIDTIEGIAEVITN